ncbi:MAG: PRC-barrel domain-containing protein [Prolixibacteraceae bacterium]
MLVKTKILKDFKLDCNDGELGKVKDFYFDDHHWMVRYLIADTGNWLTGKQVLISPNSLKLVDVQTKRIDINLSRQQIEDSPSLENDMPVSQQFEEAYYRYHRWPNYWGESKQWGYYPSQLNENEERKGFSENIKTGDPHLRSTNNISGYNIEAIDGEIGHVVDFIVDNETWAIRYMMIETSNWFDGKKVLISPQWIDHIDWKNVKVCINLSRESIKLAPEYTEKALLTRDYEAQLHKYYNRNVYWPENPSDKDRMF